jgi:hypothetical protein
LPKLVIRGTIKEIPILTEKILLEDIFGHVAEKKEAREGNPKLRKEEKATKAYESFALLARVVSFPTGLKFITNALVGGTSIMATVC